MEYIHTESKEVALTRLNKAHQLSLTSLKELDTLPTTHAQTLYARDSLSTCAHILSTTFDPEDFSTPRALPPQAKWRTLESTLKETRVQYGLINATPYFWQLQTLVNRASKETCITTVEVSPRNIDIIEPFVRQANIDACVSTRDISMLIHTLLSDANCTSNMRLNLIVESLIQCTQEYNAPLGTFREGHLIPGVPILYQSSFIAHEYPELFLLSQEHLWEIHDTHVYVTSLAEEDVLFLRCELPIILEPVNTQSTHQAYRPSIV